MLHESHEKGIEWVPSTEGKNTFRVATSGPETPGRLREIAIAQVTVISRSRGRGG